MVVERVNHILTFFIFVLIVVAGVSPPKWSGSLCSDVFSCDAIHMEIEEKCYFNVHTLGTDNHAIKFRQGVKVRTGYLCCHFH